MEMKLEKIDEFEKRAISQLEIALKDVPDVSKYLDERDKSPFDSNWSEAFEKNEKAKEALSPKEKKSLEKRSSDVRETVFKLVDKAAGSSDLAGYISDDFGLIADELALGSEDPWVKKMAEDYLAGKLPR
jgi:hypothetical protein